MRLRRVVGLTAILLVVGTGLVACKKQNSDKDKVKAFIDATAQLPYRFAYTDTDLNKTMSVVGISEDALRFKAELSIDGTPTWDEVVDDDGVYDRFLDVGALPIVATGKLAYVTPQAFAQAEALLGTAPPPTTQNGVIQPFDALRTGRWLFDPTGAPSLLPSAGEHRVLGNDPMFDAVTALQYVRTAVDAAAFVRKYDPESLEPTYKPAEDPFPRPARGSGIDRYDLKEEPLPAASVNGSFAAPQVSNFRKMAVYVRHGRVIEVREKIDVLSHVAELAHNYHASVPQGAHATAADQINFVVQLYNRYAVASGNDPLRVRTMTLQLLDVGQPQTVQVPTQDVVTGSASLLPFQGLVAGTQGGQGTGSQGAASPGVASTGPTLPGAPGAAGVTSSGVSTIGGVGTEATTTTTAGGTSSAGP